MPLSDEARELLKSAPRQDAPASGRSKPKGSESPQQATQRVEESYARGGAQARAAISGAIPEGVKAPAKDLLHKTQNVVRSVEGMAEGILHMRRRKIEQLAAGEISPYEALRPDFTAVREAGLEGIKNPQSYKRTFGEKAGAALDFIQPATGILGEVVGTPAVRLASIPLGAGARLTGRGIEKLAEKSSKVDAAVELAKTAREHVSLPYRQKRLGIEGVQPIRRRHAGRVAMVERMKESEGAKTIRELLPNQVDREEIFSLLEEPVHEMGPATAHVHAAKVASLSRAKQKAYRVARELRKDIENEKIAGKVLDEERAINLEVGEGFRHVPRQLADRDEALEAIGKSLQDNPNQPWLHTLKAEVEAMPRSELAKRLQNWRGGIRRAGFTRKRNIAKSLEEMGPASRIFKQDAADVLEVDRLDTARAVADRKYLEELDQFLEQKSVSQELDPALIESGQWVKQPSYFPGLRSNRMVPKAVAKELYGQTARAISEEAPHITYYLMDRANKMFRNWTLFLSPEYYMHNVAGSAFNNYVKLGMGMDSVQDYAVAGLLNKKIATGELSNTAKVGKTGMTEAELADFMAENRVINAGISSDAAISVLNKNRDPSFMRRLFSLGDKNPMLRGGHALQNTIENEYRIAAFLNQVRKGKTLEQAVEGTIGANFDYLLNATRFESKVMREIFPFYLWSRFNWPLQIQMLAKNPHRYFNIARGTRALEMARTGDKQPDETMWPEYLANSAHTNIGFDEKKNEWLVLKDGQWIPATDLEKGTSWSKMGREILGQTTPFLKVPIEVAGNINTFLSTDQKKVPLEQFKNEKENVLGVNVPRRAVAYPVKSVRPVRLLDDAAQAYRNRDPEKPISSTAREVVVRWLFGKATKINVSETEDRWWSSKKRELSTLRGKLKYEDNPANITELEKQMDAIIQQMVTEENKAIK